MMMNSGGSDTPKPKRGLVRSGIRALSGGIGLASESIKSYKQGKTEDQKSQSREPASSNENEVQSHHGDAPPHERTDTYTEEVHDHEDLDETWNLDDAQEEAVDKPLQIAPNSAAQELEDDFIRNNPPPAYTPSTQSQQLLLPVILPQRRPKERSRGFVRAYAPGLENCGIDQTTWLAFLDNFQRSSAANPWLNCINFAQFATLALPTPISFAVGLAIQEATRLTMELQSRQRYDLQIGRHN